jgi:hypothetical protein
MMSPSGACQAVQKFTEGQVGLDSARTVLQVEFGPGSFGTNAKRSGGYLRYLWARRPEIAGGNVYRVPRCLAPCQPRLTCQAAAHRTGTPFGHIPGHAKGPFPTGKGP